MHNLPEDLQPPMSTLVEEFEVGVQYMRPVIVGCTSEDLSNQNLLDQCTKLGFQDMFNAPLTQLNIKEDLQPYLVDRAVKIVS